MRSTEMKFVHLVAAMMATVAMTFGLLQLSAFKRLDTQAFTVYSHRRRDHADQHQSVHARVASRGHNLRTGGSFQTIYKPVSTRPADANRTSSSNTPKRVAIAFYGLTRSLQYTIQSIREHVFDMLADAGYEFHVYLHTYDLTTLERSRSGEAMLLNTSEWRLLDADFHKITQQDAFLEEYKLPIAACKMFSRNNDSSASSEDYYKDDFQSVNNLLCQLNSLQEVTSMWRASGHDYHAVLYLRPDILYNCPFPTAALDHLDTGSVYIADFHHWHGYNDRFAMGHPDTVGLWGDRLNYALSTCMRQQLHAESLVSDLLQHFHLQAQMLPFYFFRVRANGALEERDYNPRWKKHQVQACDKAKLDSFASRQASALLTAA